MLQIVNPLRQGLSLCSGLAECILQRRPGPWPDYKHLVILRTVLRECQEGFAVVPRGCEGHGYLHGTALLGAGPCDLQHPHCSE